MLEAIPTDLMRSITPTLIAGIPIQYAITPMILYAPSIRLAHIDWAPPRYAVPRRRINSMYPDNLHNQLETGHEQEHVPVILVHPLGISLAAPYRGPVPCHPYPH